MSKPNWLDLLRTEVQAQGGVIKKAAQKLGYSRTTISLCLKGVYPGKTDAVEARVLDVLARVTCSYSGEVMAYHECRMMREREAPTHNPAQLRHWKACLACEHNPQRQTFKDRISMEEVA